MELPEALTALYQINQRHRLAFIDSHRGDEDRRETQCAEYRASGYTCTTSPFLQAGAAGPILVFQLSPCREVNPPPASGTLRLAVTSSFSSSPLRSEVTILLALYRKFAVQCRYRCPPGCGAFYR